MSNPHPLIGRYLVWDEPTHEYWTLARFKKKIGEDLFLMEQLRPADGQHAVGGDFVLHLHQVTINDNLPDGQVQPHAQIFDDWEAVEQYAAEMDAPAAEKILHLVKKP